MPIKPTLMEELFLLRRRKKWNRIKVGAMLKVPVPTLRAWEEGSRPVKPVIEKTIRAFIEEHADK